VWGEDGRFEEFVISINEIVTGRNWEKKESFRVGALRALGLRSEVCETTCGVGCRH